MEGLSFVGIVAVNYAVYPQRVQATHDVYHRDGGVREEMPSIDFISCITTATAAAAGERGGGIISQCISLILSLSPP